MSPKRICLVTSAHASYNPRMVKEADALTEAGYEVRAVGLNREDAKWRLDQQLMERRPWRYEAVDARPENWLGHYRRAMSKARARLCSTRLGPALTRHATTYAFSRYFPELLDLAGREPAALYIAHNLPALPVAAMAARQAGAAFAFDAEDFHRGEVVESPENETFISQVAAIEQAYIPGCAYVSAASDGIGRLYEENLAIERPTTILNVFPLSMRDAEVDRADVEQERGPAGVSLYWYSQVIGPGRGLEVAIHALSRLRPRVSLTLRGEWVSGYKDALLRLARQLGVAELVHERASRPPEQLVALAALHDVGLASEVPETLNRHVAVSNKLLAYLLAGIPVAASNVQGQVAVMESVPGAGFIYDAQDPDALSGGLARLCESSRTIAAAKRAALEAARSRLCWDVESRRLVSLVSGVLQKHA